MRKDLLFLFAAIVTLIAISCNNSNNADAGTPVKTKADSLYEEVLDGHDVGMGNMGPLTRAQQEASRVLDSLRTLPGKAKEASAPFQAKVESLLNELKQANNSMNKWMDEFEIDSFKNNTEERIKYMASEKVKVTEVKEAVLNGIQKADSLFKKKFRQQ